MKKCPAARNYPVGMHKKGQFFIMGAVIILLVLYSVSQNLNSNWKTDVSKVQGNDAAEVFENLEYNINKTIAASDASNFKENLETLMLFQKNTIGNTYSLDYHVKTLAPNTVITGLKISSKGTYAERKSINYAGFEVPDSDNLELGESCSIGTECSSTYCADGVCCNSACIGNTCQRCDGYSSNGIGICGYVSSPLQDPDNECGAGLTATNGCMSNTCSGYGYGCGIQTSGKGGCPACTQCSDSDIACENIGENLDPYNECHGIASCNGLGECEAINPDAFSFVNQNGVAMNTPITSNAVTLSGGFSNLPATCTNGCTMSKNGGAFSGSGTLTFSSGDIIRVNLTSAANYNAANTTAVTIGSTTSGIWSVTTETVDYISVNLGGCAPAKTANQMCQENGYSSALDAKGYWHVQCGGPSIISCSELDCIVAVLDCTNDASSHWSYWAGNIRAGGGGTLYNPQYDYGNYDCSGWNAGYYMRLKCYGVCSGCSNPNAFSFINQNGVAINAAIISNEVTLTGGFTDMWATCTNGCTMSKNGGAFSGSGTLKFSSGDIIRVSLASSANYNTANTTAVTIGSTTSGVWSVTTAALIWYDPLWNYRKPISISGSASALTNYQVLVTIDTQSLITAGKLRSDCGDVRFTDSDKTTLIPYWIETGCNTASTKIWVNISSIPAGGTTIYMYYGNAAAASASNGVNTFLAFDDFSGDLSKWIVGASARVTIVDGEMEIYGNNAGNAFGNHYVISNQNILRPAIIEWTSHSIQLQSDVIEGIVDNGFNFAGGHPNPALTFYKNWDPNGPGLDIVYNAVKISDVGSYVKENKVPSKIELPLAQGFKMYYDNSLAYDDITAVFDNYKFIAAPWQGLMDYVYMDDYRVRRYASPEPLVSLIGGEETQ